MKVIFKTGNHWHHAVTLDRPAPEGRVWLKAENGAQMLIRKDRVRPWDNNA